jgi:predicted dehydrogenase
MILCEKPLALNGTEAEKMVKAVEKAGVPNMVWYNYRRCSGRRRSPSNLIDAGKLGRMFHYRANFLQDWTINPELPARRHGPLAPRRQGRRLRRHGRPARALHRHRALAQRRHQGRDAR